MLPKVIPIQCAYEHVHITVAEVEFGSDGETLDGVIADAKEIKPVAVKVNQIGSNPITANSAWLVALTDASLHNVSVLDLSGGGVSELGLVEMQLLADVLLQTRISTLNLSGLNLTCEAVEPLLSVLSQTHVSCLDLSDNDFEEGVLRALGSELQKETCKLRELFLDQQVYSPTAIDSFLTDLIKAPGGVESLILCSRLSDTENHFNNIRDLCQLMKMGSLTRLEVNLRPGQLDEFHQALIHPACNLLYLIVRVLTGSRDVRLVNHLQAFKHPNCKVARFELSGESLNSMSTLVDVLESPSCKLRHIGNGLAPAFHFWRG